MYNQPSFPPSSYHHQPIANHGIHGNVLEVNVVGCNKLKDTEWISRQDPYVCVEYGINKSRTRVCTDGSKNPIFQEKFMYSLIEGLRELNIIVWNSNTLSHDDFIGSGKVQLAKVLYDGFDDSYWPLQSKTGRYAGEIRLIMHYSSTNKPANGYATSAPPYVVSGQPPNSYATSAPSYVVSGPPQVSMYSAPPPPAVGYPVPSAAYSYPPNSGGYPPSPAAPFPPHGYGTSHYPPYPGGYPPPY